MTIRWKYHIGENMKWLRTHNKNDLNQKSETALSDKGYNDATVKALFRLMDRLKDSDHVVDMAIDSRMTSTNLYKVELTATYDVQLGKSRNSLNDLKSKLDKALYQFKDNGRSYKVLPAGQVAQMYRQNDVVADTKKAS